MEYTIEVITIPVTDVDRAKDFYTKVGFSVDVDYAPTSQFRVVQLTPPGSACSIQIGVGITDAEPGSSHSCYLVVNDLRQAQTELEAAGIAVSGPEHKAPLDTWAGGFEPGIDPDRTDYASFLRMVDPDGNTWLIQERGHHR